MKKTSKLLGKLNKKDGSVFDTERVLVGRGQMTYTQGEGLYIGGKRIPLSSIRNIDVNFNGRGPLLFVDPNYKLAEAYKN